jgi:predicted metal-dependent hydrolase
MDTIKIDKIIRSRRRTLSISVNNIGQFIVRAPLPLAEHAIIDFINRKREWVHKRKKTIKKRMAEVKPKVFVEDEEFMFLGRNYKLKLVAGDQIQLSQYLEFPVRFLPKANYFLLRWYKRQALSVIGERVKLCSELMGLRAKSIRITSARTRWGSCSRENGLNFTWRLIMAPLDIVDYVVVHELAHISEKNHSLKFWNKVKSCFCDFKQRRTWLKVNGYLLMV